MNDETNFVYISSFIYYLSKKQNPVYLEIFQILDYVLGRATEGSSRFLGAEENIDSLGQSSCYMQLSLYRCFLYFCLP